MPNELIIFQGSDQLNLQKSICFIIQADALQHHV